MSWNYRIVKHEDELVGPWLGLHEVFYDEARRPRCYSETPIVVGQDPNEIRTAVELMAHSLDAYPDVLLEGQDFTDDLTDLGLAAEV